EAPHFVHASGVVGVHMGEEQAVHLSQVGAERLVAQVRRGIHQDIHIVDAKHHRRAKPGIARVWRRAPGAITANDRDASRCSGSKEFKLNHGSKLSGRAAGWNEAQRRIGSLMRVYERERRLIEWHGSEMMSLRGIWPTPKNVRPLQC